LAQRLKAFALLQIRPADEVDAIRQMRITGDHCQRIAHIGTICAGMGNLQMRIAHIIIKRIKKYRSRRERRKGMLLGRLTPAGADDVEKLQSGQIANRGPRLFWSKNDAETYELRFSFHVCACFGAPAPRSTSS
jgi:hypothetical protein